MNRVDKEKVLNIIKEHKEYFETGETKVVDFRLKQLEKLKNAVKSNEDLIIEALGKDLHKPELEAYATEIGFLYDSIKYSMKNLKKWAKVKSVKTPIVHLGAKSYIYPEPYGTVLIIGPYNYPFQLVMEPLVGAIAAGNCVVLKPSEFTPNVSKVLEKVIKENFDERYIRLIQGGKETTSALINAPFDYIFFTGSVRVGKIVMEAAGRNLVPVTLELGGKSPTIVHKDANIDAAAQRIVWGKFINTGQTCVAPDYIYAHKDVRNQLIEKMKESIKKFYGENPKESKDYGRIVNEVQIKRLIELIDSTKVIVGGEYDEKNLYIAPTIMKDVTWEDKVMEEEIFGPILPVLDYENLDDIIKIINSRPKPLALYVFTESKAVGEKVIESVSYGGGCVNDTITHLSTPHLPFGGVGSSGLGSYHGAKSFETFSHYKSVLKKSTKINLSFIFPPYTKEKLDLLKKYMK